MIWECRSLKGAETQSLGDSTTGMVHALRDVRHRSLPNTNQSNWWSWVENYTGRSLTRVSDRPAAFYGVIEHYSYRVKDERLTGLWTQSLLRDLLWRSQKPGARLATSPSARIPTWSWLSIDSKIMAPANVDVSHTAIGGGFIVSGGISASIWKPVAKLVEVQDFLFFTSAPNSWLGSSTLVLKGILQSARVSRHQSGRYSVRVIEEGVELEAEPCWIDCECEIPSTGLVQCFWIGLSFGYPGMPQFALKEVLILIPAGVDGFYHRIGVSRIHAERLFADQDITRYGRRTEDGQCGIHFAQLDKENAVRMGFLNDCVVITLR